MAISIVQSITGTGTSVTLGSATTAGNCLVVCVGDNTSSSSVTAVKLGGSAGNFVALKTVTVSLYGMSTIWADPNCAGGQTAIAITDAGNSAPIIAAYEITGIAASSVLDQSAGANNFGTSWSTGATGATANLAEAVIGFATFTNANTITGPSSPWTNLTQITNGATCGMTGYQITAATGTYTYSGTGTNNRNYTAAVVTLKGTVATAPAGPGLIVAQAVKRASLY